MERAYRRHPSAESRAVWTDQFKAQRLLFRQKATDYWSSAIADSLSDPRRLWQKIARVIKPPTTTQIPHSADDLASHFVGKVNKIRISTASSADQMVIRSRSAETGLSSFQLVTAEDAFRLISRAPCKHCDLDPAPRLGHSETTCRPIPDHVFLCRWPLQATGIFLAQLPPIFIGQHAAAPCVRFIIDNIFLPTYSILTKLFSGLCTFRPLRLQYKSSSGDEIHAVSYTHLTLPTKRIV